MRAASLARAALRGLAALAVGLGALATASCDDAACLVGAEGCDCDADTDCPLPNLTCQEGQCAVTPPVCDGQGRCRPANPQCFTPCSRDLLEADGTVRTCSDEGLMRGCLAGAGCVSGRCVPDALQAGDDQGAFGSCSDDAQCPDFQTCVDGECFSNCEVVTDCAPGSACHRHVCRQECSEKTPCPDGLVCSDTLCVPKAPRGAPPPPPVDGALVLDRTRMELGAGPNPTFRTFSVTNTSSTTLTVVVSKKEQRTTAPDGAAAVVRKDRDGAPLAWLEIGVGSTNAVAEFPVDVAPGATVTVSVEGARNPELTQWSGVLEVRADGTNPQEIRLSYSERVEGRWVGEMHTFGNFEDGRGPQGAPLDDWATDPGSTALADAVPNALVGVWARMRNGILRYDEVDALIAATLTGSWQTPRVQQLCEEAGFFGAACAPAGGTGSSNVIPYTSDAVRRPIPSGIVQTALALDLRRGTPSDAACAQREHCYIGRIDSSEALQYPGDPAVVVAFEGPPADCLPGQLLGCVAPIADLEADVAIGARYVPRAAASDCRLLEDAALLELPSLVPGFTPSGRLLGSDARARRSCRDTTAPFGSSAENTDFAAANPIPDGRRRLRHIELLDGLMLEQRAMMLLLKETSSGIGTSSEPFVAYSYAVLELQEAAPDPEATVGNDVMVSQEPVGDLLAPACSETLLAHVDAFRLDELDQRGRSNLASVVGDGRVGSRAAPIDLTQNPVHTLCVFRQDAVVDEARGVDAIESIQRGLFGAGADGAVPCPPSAQVIYFQLDDASPSYDPTGEPCNQTIPETCDQTLAAWVASDRPVHLRATDRTAFPDAPAAVAFDLVVECADPEAASCTDRFDLTAGKQFFRAGGDVAFAALASEIDEAFRYKREFVSRTGGSVGFSPVLCQPGTSLDPYCYDPAAIERIALRVDCALTLYHGHLSGDAPLDEEAAASLLGYLDRSFSQLQREVADGDPVVEQGFERLYAELLIMLGDEAVAKAFGGRFDAAGSQQLSFPGSVFEVDGPDLAGALGFEMYELYEATEYYDRVLDRFYSLAPGMLTTLELPGETYVTQKTVTSYVSRVVRASTQQAAAWEAIAERYHSMNEPALARKVLERQYARTHQEAQVLARLMDALMRRVDASSLDQIRLEIDDAQRRYRVALLGMREVYDRITDRVNFFGLALDFVPFPALDEDVVNGFEVMLERAQQRLDVAREHERTALESRRDFDVDAAAFQGELVSVRNEFAAQLGEICGSFTGTDGAVHPAITRFSHLDPNIAVMDDPCGMFGAGAIAVAIGDLETRNLELQRVQQEVDNTLEAISDQGRWLAQQCQLKQEDALAFAQAQGAVDGLQRDIESAEGTVSELDKAKGMVDIAVDITVDALEDAGEAFEIATETDPVKKTWKIVEHTLDVGATIGKSVTLGLAATAHFIGTSVLEQQIRSKQETIRSLEAAYGKRSILRECDYLTVESASTLRELHMQLNLLELDALNAIWNVQVQLSEIESLGNQRQRLEAEWGDADQIAIDAAAATSDPNVRIFKNDAILNAERSFELAAREVFRATRVFEFYTAQSYAPKEELFLIRTAEAGELNLELYLTQLQDAFFDFEEGFGNPDSRVAVISTRDDILKVPRYSDDGLNRQLTVEERIDIFRDRLQDPALLDQDGQLTLRFDTTFDQLSPRTVNHKILFIEVELFGDTGDLIGRVYLRQTGTGVVEGTDGERRFFTFPPRTSVINPLFNGDRSFGQDSDGAISGPNRSIFRSMRFRERPFVQTNWELVLNQETEAVNEDINLNGLDDIVVYVYYTDFTPQ